MSKTTIHAIVRARKRMGVADVSQSFETALEHGVQQRDLKGQLARYISIGAREHKSSAVIYRGYIYWFKPKTQTLITVVPLHQKWHKYLKRPKDGDAK